MFQSFRNINVYANFFTIIWAKSCCEHFLTLNDLKRLCLGVKEVTVQYYNFKNFQFYVFLMELIWRFRAPTYVGYSEIQIQM